MQSKMFSDVVVIASGEFSKVEHRGWRSSLCYPGINEFTVLNNMGILLRMPGPLSRLPLDNKTDIEIYIQ